MNTKNFFTTEAVICLLFGITLTFMPDYLGNEYLTNPSNINEGAIVVARGYGSLLLSLAVAHWFVRNAQLSIGRRSMLIAAFLSNLLLLIIHPMAIFSKVETGFTWGTVIICAIMAAWGGFLLSKEKIVD